MYSVVAHNADPYLELDIPVTFSSHAEALEYAIRTAIVFRGAPGAPTGFRFAYLRGCCRDEQDTLTTLAGRRYMSTRPKPPPYPKPPRPPAEPPRPQPGVSMRSSPV